MKRITLAALAGAAVLVAGPAFAQNIDFSKVEVNCRCAGSAHARTPSREPSCRPTRGGASCRV
jgi:hypothetical protein